MPAFVREFLAGRPELTGAAAHEAGHATMSLLFGYTVTETGLTPFLGPQLGVTHFAYRYDPGPDGVWRQVLVQAAGAAAMMLRNRAVGPSAGGAHDAEDRGQAEALLAMLPQPAPDWDHTVNVACGILGDHRVWPILLAVEAAIMDELRLDAGMLSRVVEAAGGLPAVPSATTGDDRDAGCIDEADAFVELVPADPTN